MMGANASFHDLSAVLVAFLTLGFWGSSRQLRPFTTGSKRVCSFQLLPVEGEFAIRLYSAI